MKGFFNKILRINASTKSFVIEPVADAVYREYLGGKGLATHLLLENNPPGIDPFAPENRIIFAAGCVTDTRVWGSSRYGVFTKSPLTRIYSESYSGGSISIPMSRTGYDAIIIEGACPEPVFIEVTDEGARFHSAADLWGKGTYETEDQVREKIGAEETGAVVIGPAGENMVRFALIENDYWRSCGRTGVGAVLGSKKIKALVFHGKQSREVAYPEMVNASYDELGTRKDEDAQARSLKQFGTAMIVAFTNMVRAFPAQYWSAGTCAGWENLTAEKMLERCRVESHACPHCFIACGKLTEVTQGRHQGLKIGGPEYETIFAFGGLCLIDSLEEIMYLNDLCDNLGIDTMTAGNLAAFTIEASQRGKISEKINYGDVDAIAQLLRKMVHREGIGAVLAEGIVYAAKTWGLEDLAVHVKGQEPAGYDPRILKGMALAYATSHRGACHLRSSMFGAEIQGDLTPQSVDEKVAVFVDTEERYVLMDSLILCRFYRDLAGWDQLGQLIYAATGMSLDQTGLKKIASTIIDDTRRFNIQEGITSKDDTIPKRFFKEGIGPDKAVIRKEDLEMMVKAYYRFRGWDENGVPPERR
ncbi:MAG TPA: aldehyde ferredoxin oxidoreductase family protein [Thermodesulfobacteriota bacterium]|nr:aldehyde ferredoxin oxidoreductase family protein [Thermodesulfobacteriota bacterium]HNU70284.1 aldehyde ferredoxin oxidoreductase family protein [Thermodesulfobacteriota bacterium]HQO77609.1 aldehyde ferredoxin oxidoreductase family protein [Thermodesulfobacteriota bacterium]